MITRTKQLTVNVLGHTHTVDLNVTFTDTGEIILEKNGKEFEIDLSGIISNLPGILNPTLIETADAVYYQASFAGYWIRIGLNFTALPNALKFFLKGNIPWPITFALPLKRVNKLKIRGLSVFGCHDDEEDEEGNPVGEWISIDFTDMADYVIINQDTGTITVNLPQRFDIDPILKTSTTLLIPYSPHKAIVILNGVIYVFYQDTADYYIHYYYSTDDGVTWTYGGAVTSSLASIGKDWIDVKTDGTYIYLHVGTGNSYGYGQLRAYSQDPATKELVYITSTTTVEVVGSGSTGSTHFDIDADKKLWCVVNHYTSWPAYHNYIGVEVFTFDGSAFTSLGKYYEEISTTNVTTNYIRITGLGGSKALIVYVNASNDNYTYYWVVSTDGTTVSKTTSGLVWAGAPSYGYRFGVISNNYAGKALLVMRRGSKYAEAVEYTESTDTWGYWLAMNSPTATTYWALTADYDEGEGLYYDFSVESLSTTLAKISVASGSLSPTRDEVWHTLEAQPSYYFNYTVFLDKSTGYVHVNYVDTTDNLRWERIQYKTVVTPTLITETVFDAVGFGETVIGSLNAGLADNVGMIDLKSGSPTQNGSDTVNLLEILGLTRMAAAGIFDAVGVNAALVAGTVNVITDVTGLNAISRGVLKLKMGESIGTAEKVTLNPAVFWVDAVVLADDMGLTVTGRLLELMGVMEAMATTAAGVNTSTVGLNEGIISGAYLTIVDAVTLTDVVNALEQILIQTQFIADALGLTAVQKSTVALAVSDLILSMDALKTAVDVLMDDVMGLADTITAVELLSVITEVVADVIGMVDGVTANVVNVELTAVLLKSKLWGSTDKQLKDDVGVIAKESGSTALGVIDGLGLPDELLTVPRAVVKEVIPLFVEVIERYAYAIAVFDDMVGLNDMVRGSISGVSLSDVLTLVDDVTLLKWLFAREVLKLYSRITALIVANSILTALDAHKSIIDAVKGAESGVVDYVKLRSILKEKIGR